MAIRFFSLLILLLLVTTAHGQNGRTLDGRDAEFDRLVQLEREIEALRAEIRQFDMTPVRLPPVEQSPVSFQSTEPDDLVTLDELRGEMKRLAWKQGNFTIVLYGYFWSNMVYTTQRTAVGTYTLFVHSASQSNESEFIVDARNSRLGVEVGGPDMCFFGEAKSGGRIEADFQNAVLSTENKPTIVLRHAYWELKNDSYRLLFGQTWDVVSPLIPGVWNAGACWDAGNIGYRRTQLRGERYFDISERCLLTAQCSLNVQVFQDYDTVRIGKPSNWPVIEGRAAWTFGERGEKSSPITFGISGHIGDVQFDHIVVDRSFNRRTWSGNLDLQVPLSERLGLQAEVFTGENLSAFLGGIGQGINPITLDTISGSGGWFEVWFDWTKQLRSCCGYSIDDPVDSDLAAGQRKYNHCYYGNLTLNLTKQFQIAGEVSSWRTLYADRLPGDSVRIEFVARYGF